MGILQFRTAALRGVVCSGWGILWCTAALQWGGSGQWVASIHCHKGQWALGILQCTAALHGALGTGDPPCTASVSERQWPVGIPLYIATRGGGQCGGQWGSFSALPHCTGQWAVGHPTVQYRAARASRQWGSFSTPLHCRGLSAMGIPLYTATLQGVVGNGYPSVHCHTVVHTGQWGAFMDNGGPSIL